MAEPANSILLIATEVNGADGFVNKIAPEAPITTLGYSKQGLPYQHMNYMLNNHALWLKYINEEQVPEETQLREDADNVLQNNIDNEASTRASADTTLQDNIDSEASTRSSADSGLQNQIDQLGVGYLQTWQDVTGSRFINTTYTNSTGKPIQVCISFNCSASTVATITINGLTMEAGSAGVDTATDSTVSFIVPTGNTYRISGYSVMRRWIELRG